MSLSSLPKTDVRKLTGLPEAAKEIFAREEISLTLNAWGVEECCFALSPVCSFPPCAAMSTARLVLTAGNGDDCSHILGVTQQGFCGCRHSALWSLSLLHVCFWTSSALILQLSVCCGNWEQKAGEQAQPAAHLEAVT